MVNKADVAAEVAERLKGADADARQYVDTVFDVIMRHVAAGERVQIVGFGTFDSVERAARIGRNPRTGAAIQVPAGTSPRFHAGQTFRSQVTEGSPATAAAPAEAQQDTAKPAKAKKAKATEKAKAAEKKAEKVVADKPAKSAKKPDKPTDKPADKKPAKEPKVSKKIAKKIAKKPAKTGKTAKK